MRTERQGGWYGEQQAAVTSATMSDDQRGRKQTVRLERWVGPRRREHRMPGQRESPDTVGEVGDGFLPGPVR